MKKELFNKLLLPLLSLILVVGCINVNNAYALEESNFNTITNCYESTSAKKVNYLELAADVIWRIIKYADSAYFLRVPTVTYGANSVTSNTGSIKFNSGDYGACVQAKINLGKSNMMLKCFAQTNFLNWTNKIAITLDKPNNDGMVINKAVTHNQHATYNTQSPYGTYTLKFTQTDTSKWDCYYTLYDYDVTSTSAVQTTYDMNGVEQNAIYDNVNSKTYFVPSSFRVQEKASLKNKYITAELLDNQFYDEKLKLYVNDLKDYSIGDEILFKDSIHEISYDSENDYTMIKFKTSDTTINWPFKGDLTSRYKVTDELTLKFKVVEEYKFNDYLFENLDYILEGQKLIEESNYPDIDKYIY